MQTKRQLYFDGMRLLHRFCQANAIKPPAVLPLEPGERLYGLATCAFYRPHTIKIMVNKCASPGTAGRAWSWPGYVIDRTPYGVLQHELGHHVDTVKFIPDKFTRDAAEIATGLKYIPEGAFCYRIYGKSLEDPLTNYVGHEATGTLGWFMEWFAENFRLFVTNSELCRALRPKFHAAMLAEGFKPVVNGGWAAVLGLDHSAPERILAQAQKKTDAVRGNQLCDQ